MSPYFQENIEATFTPCGDGWYSYYIVSCLELLGNVFIGPRFNSQSRRLYIGALTSFSDVKHPLLIFEIDVFWIFPYKHYLTQLGLKSYLEYI